MRAFFRINEYINIVNPVRAVARDRELRSNKTETCLGVFLPQNKPKQVRARAGVKATLLIFQ